MRDPAMGITGLSLRRGDDDPEPLVLLDTGTTFAETVLNDGTDTVLVEVPAASLRPGVYTQARIMVSHARFKADATYHTPTSVTPGEFERLTVLSDGILVDKKTRKSGEHRSTFRVSGIDLGTHEAVSPLQDSVGGVLKLEVKEGRAAFVIGTNVELPSQLAGDTKLVIEVNVHEGLRWADREAPNYKKNVWDLEEDFYEGVTQSGPNSIELRLEGAK